MLEYQSFILWVIFAALVAIFVLCASMLKVLRDIRHVLTYDPQDRKNVPYEYERLIPEKYKQKDVK